MYGHYACLSDFTGQPLVVQKVSQDLGWWGSLICAAAPYIYQLKDFLFPILAFENGS
jgi:hypothetical protein